MKGGFVTRNCPLCGNYETLPGKVFKYELDLWVACPECRRRMEPTVLPDQNYGFVCEDCDVAIELYSLLPRFDEL
jgi:endogenous inhibitor of DNA gyrase (YacG/DUF329 family)